MYPVRMRTFVAVCLPVTISIILSSCFTGKKNAAQLTNTPLLFAHRGVSLQFPENSAGAYLVAKQKGFKAIETDIQYTADNQLVIFHDDDARRLLNIDSSINDMHSGFIKKQRLLFNKRKSNSSVLMLDSLLKRYKGDFVIYLDVKFTKLKLVKKLVKTIEKFSAERSVIVASTSVKCIFYIELFYPKIITALEGFKPGKEWIYHAIPKKLQPDFYSGTYEDVTEEHVRWMQENNFFGKRIVFGVDSSNYSKASEEGFKNIIIDYYAGLSAVY